MPELKHSFGIPLTKRSPTEQVYLGMTTLRIRVELNKGRIGMPLGKLAAICAETVKFLNMLSDDLQLTDGEPVWLAENFENDSVDYDCRLANDVGEARTEIGRRALRLIMGETLTLDDPELAFKIRPETRRQYFHIAAPIDPDEKVRFGVYLDGGAKPDLWYDLARHEEALVSGGVIDRGAYGEIQGIVHAFFKEGRRPHLRVRELATQQFVKCFFRMDMYNAAVELLNDRTAVVFVEGHIREDANTGETREIDVEDFRLAPDFSKDNFEKFLGTIPDYTGAITTEEFVEQLRE